MREECGLGKKRGGGGGPNIPWLTASLTSMGFELLAADGDIATVVLDQWSNPSQELTKCFFRKSIFVMYLPHFSWKTVIFVFVCQKNTSNRRRTRIRPMVSDHWGPFIHFPRWQWQWHPPPLPPPSIARQFWLNCVRIIWWWWWWWW